MDVDLGKARVALKDLEGVDVVANLEIRTGQRTCPLFMDEETMKRTQRRQLLARDVLWRANPLRLIPEALPMKPMRV